MNDIKDATAEALAKLATEQHYIRAGRISDGECGRKRWYVWQRLRGTDQHAIAVFQRWNVETYYPYYVELRAVPRRQLSHAQRRSGITVQKPREVPLFPGYIFALFNPERADLREMADMAGVGGFVCREGQPVYMPDTIIAAIRQRERGGLIAGDDSVRVVFGVGEEVRVTDGPFASFPGIVEQGLDVPINKLEPRTRITVAVNIFGRATPVSLELWQVQKSDK